LDFDVSNDGGLFISKSEQTKKDSPYFFIGLSLIVVFGFAGQVDGWILD
jgi:hypothetical protein